jgi:hypothetical protein
MGVLLRLALALVIAILLTFILMMFFALAGRRRPALHLESGRSSSPHNFTALGRRHGGGNAGHQ